MQEMSAGLFDKEPRQEFTEEELTKLSLNPPVRRENKKTKQQRRKEKERKEKVTICTFEYGIAGHIQYSGNY